MNASPMLQLPILRNHPRLLLHLLRRIHASNRHPPPPQSPRPAETKTHSPLSLRHGHLRHRLRSPYKSLLSRPLADLLRVYELVLPGSDGCDPRHESTARLVASEGYLPDPR